MTHRFKVGLLFCVISFVVAFIWFPILLAVWLNQWHFEQIVELLSSNIVFSLLVIPCAWVAYYLTPSSQRRFAESASLKLVFIYPTVLALGVTLLGEYQIQMKPYAVGWDARSPTIGMEIGDAIPIFAKVMIFAFIACWIPCSAVLVLTLGMLGLLPPTN